MQKTYLFLLIIIFLPYQKIFAYSTEYPQIKYECKVIKTYYKANNLIDILPYSEKGIECKSSENNKTVTLDTEKKNLAKFNCDDDYDIVLKISFFPFSYFVKEKSKKGNFYLMKKILGQQNATHVQLSIFYSSIQDPTKNTNIEPLYSTMIENRKGDLEDFSLKLSIDNSSTFSNIKINYYAICTKICKF